MKQDEQKRSAVERFKSAYPRVFKDAPYARQVEDGFNHGFDAGLATAATEIEIIRRAKFQLEILEEKINETIPLDASIAETLDRLSSILDGEDGYE